MEQLRVGLVGCGRIGSEFEDLSSEHPASIAGAFDALPQTKLVAACNRGKGRLDAFGQRWGVRALYQDFREMISRESLDIVAIGTHPPLHADIVEAACAAGVKGIFCEKPMALDLVDCDRIIADTDRSGVKVVVNCSRRFSGQYEAVRQLIGRQELGELIHMVGRCQGVKPIPEWESETEGPLLHDAVHLLDIMRFFGGDVASLIGIAKNRTRRFRVEDTSHAILEFENGVEGITIVDEMSEYSEFSVELNFTRGRIRLESDAPGMWRSTPNIENEHDWWQHLEACPLPEPAWEGTNILGAARNLVESIQKGSAIRCDARDGRASVELIMAIYQSQRRDGGRIRLPLQTGPSSLHALREEGLL
ncbi:MAG: Gfo/Idh/MocA family oxidoreductase [Candidatus Latescibacterota bacterium]